MQELFSLVPGLFGTASRCLSIQPFQLLPLGNIWSHISLTWPFPHRYRHPPWQVNVTELLDQFCCWTVIRLSRHWAWLRWWYWRYRNLIDWWLIDMYCTTLSLHGQKYHIMTVSEWHKIEKDGDPWQPTCWLRMAHNDDDSIPAFSKREWEGGDRELRRQRRGSICYVPCCRRPFLLRWQPIIHLCQFAETTIYTIEKQQAYL